MTIFLKKTETALVLFLTASPIWANPNIPKLAYQCSSGKQDACRELAKIASEDKEAYVRKNAVEVLNDQPLLARIAKVALEAEDTLVRRDAVSALTGQSILAKIATQEKEVVIRNAALERLTDQSLLVKIATEDSDVLVRAAAVRTLTDQSLLLQFVAKGQDARVRRAAVRVLTDQSLVERIAEGDKDASVRATAVEKLTDQSMVARIAKEDPDPTVRVAALGSLSDQLLLSKIAAEDKDFEVRHAAMGRATNQPLLAKLAEEAPDSGVRNAAVVKLIDLGFLARLKDEDENVRMAAKKLLAKHEVVVDEREIYVWRPATEASGVSSRPRWAIRGALGAAELPRSGFSHVLQSEQDELFGPAGKDPAPGFPKWYFAPVGNSEDECALLSGSARLVRVNVTMELPAPTLFSMGSLPGPSGKLAWVLPAGTSSNVVGYFIFQPFIYPTSDGTLALGGTMAVGSSFPFPRVVADPVEVSGTILFPDDRWTPTGAGFVIKGGGLQFDETGVFLIPGTVFRKDVAGSAWAGFDSDGTRYELSFLADGTLNYRHGLDVIKSAHWKQDGDAIYMELNGKYIEYQGQISGTHMDGKAWNVKGLTWTWVADRK